jgi:polar amino acid transport system substrate-binding protein
MIRRSAARTALLAGALIGGLVGCSSADTGGAVGASPGATVVASPPGSLSALVPAWVKAAGTLHIGIAGDRPPLAFSAPGSTTAAGIDADLATAMGRVMGIGITFVPEPLPQLRADVAAHHLDVALSGETDTPGHRGQGLTYVDYLSGGESILAVSGSRATGLGDLCGAPVAYVTGSEAEAAAAQVGASCRGNGRPPPVTTTVSSHAALLDALKNGPARLALDDALVAGYVATNVPSPRVEVVGPSFDHVVYGMETAKDHPQLIVVLQAALKAVIGDGSYDRTLSRWGATAWALRTAAVDGGT